MIKTQQQALHLLNRAIEFSFERDGVLRVPSVRLSNGKELVIKNHKHLRRYLEQFSNKSEVRA